MIFVAYDELMCVHCNRTGTSFTKLEQASHEAAAMMMTQQQPLKDAIQQATEAVEQAATAMDEAQENYELLLPAHRQQ
jgi:ABC-type transporter Mla subunit MlaD